MRVLVLDGNENQAVASVRSLGRAGHRVLVGATERWSKAGLSRYARGAFRYADPMSDARRFVSTLADVARGVPGTLVMPMTERTTLPISAFRQQLADAGARLVLPAHDTVLRAFDKGETTKLAGSLGVCVPRTEVLATIEDARRCADRTPYPVVLKATSSYELDRVGRVRSTGAPRYAADANGLIDAFQAIRSRASAVLLQEYVEGTGAGYFALMRHGELRAEFAHRRLRDVRPTGSGSAFRESTAVDPALRTAGLAILRALRWHGPAMVEFRVRADQSPVFMEVNGRFWNSLPLAVAAGCDFPALLATMAESGDVAPPPPYRTGVRGRWILGDIRHLLAVMKGRPAGYAGDFPRRLTTLLAVARPARGTCHDNFELTDPLPELGDWLDFIIHRLLPHARRSRGPDRP